MPSLVQLDPDSLDFPPTEQALEEPNGLLAVGGDLSPERLLAAYRRGIFPWFDESQPVLWWTPNPRAVLFPERIHISRSLQKRLRRGEFTTGCDRQFQQVMAHCAQVPRDGQSGTWITPDMSEAYYRLHQQGVAHSVEVYKDGELAGGLYGLAIGRVFFGESMFSLCRDASKVALVALARQLQAWGFTLIDCQVSNPHLFSMGAEEISRQRFNSLLTKAIDQPSAYNWSEQWQPLLKEPGGYLDQGLDALQD